MKRESMQSLLGLEPHKQEKQLKVHNGSELEATVKKLFFGFEQLGSMHAGSANNRSRVECLDYVSQFKITPQAIGLFVSLLGSYEVHGETIGDYLTALVQASYDQGHNNFRLDLRDVDRIDTFEHVKNFGYGLKGKKNSLLKVILISRTWLGWQTAEQAEYVGMQVFGGNVVTLGVGAKHSNFYATQCVSRAGEGAEHCKFTIRGGVGDVGNYAKNCKFTANWAFMAVTEGPTGRWPIDAPSWLDGAENCILKSHVKGGLRSARRHAGKGCKFWLLKGGEEEFFGET